MNWEYVSGFFDADGSVTLSNQGNSRNRTLQISFHNSELPIIESIREFIAEETGYNGSVSKKKARKETHKDSYDLKYAFFSAYIISSKLTLYHQKKVHRINTYKKIQEVTPRNGRYSEDLLKRRSELEELFWKH